jgi:hypothetical protein
VPIGSGDLEIRLSDIDLAQIAPLEQTVSVPMQGRATGSLMLTSQAGKWSKASGALELTVSDMVLGDGKSKFRGLMALPPAQLGAFVIEAKADAGTLKVEKFGASGKDVELSGEGTVKLKEPWDGSTADLWLRFGFSDEYKNKDDRTKALFVDDGPFPALINQDRKLKKAKRADGLWGFHVHGRLGRLRYDPTSADGPKGKASSGDAKKKATKKSSDDEDDEPVRAEVPSPVVPRTKPNEADKPAEAEKPVEAEKPAEPAKTVEGDKPVEAEKPAEKPTEPERAPTIPAPPNDEPSGAEPAAPTDDMIPR